MLSQVKSAIFSNFPSSSSSAGTASSSLSRVGDFVKSTSRNVVFLSMCTVTVSSYIAVYVLSSQRKALPNHKFYLKKQYAEIESQVDYFERRINEAEKEARLQQKNSNNNNNNNEENQAENETAVAEARRKVIMDLAEEIWFVDSGNHYDEATAGAPEGAKYGILPFDIPYIYKRKSQLSVRLSELVDESLKTVVDELDRRYYARVANEKDPVRRHSFLLQRYHEEAKLHGMFRGAPPTWWAAWRRKVVDYSLQFAGVQRACNMTWRLLTSTTATEAVLGKDFAEEIDRVKRRKEDALASKSSPEVVKLVAKFKTQQLNERDGGAGLLTNLVSWYNTSPLLRVELYPIGLRLAMLFGIQFAQAAFERWQRIQFGRTVRGDYCAPPSLSTRTKRAVLPAFVTLASTVVSNFAWSKLSSSITLDMSRALSQNIAYSFSMCDTQFLEKGKLRDIELFIDEDDGTEEKDRKYQIKRPLSDHQGRRGGGRGGEGGSILDRLEAVAGPGNNAIYAPVTFVKNVCDILFGVFDFFLLIRVFVQKSSSSSNQKISSFSSTSSVLEKEIAAKHAREKLMSGLTLAWWLLDSRLVTPLQRALVSWPFQHLWPAISSLTHGQASVETQAERRELWKLPLPQNDTRHGADLLLTVAVEREQKKKNSKQQNNNNNENDISNNNNNNSKQEEADSERRRLALYTCLTFQNGGCTRFAEKSRLHVWEKMKSDSEFKLKLDSVNDVVSQTVHNFYFAPYEKKTNWLQESFTIKNVLKECEHGASADEGAIVRFDKEERDILILTPLRRQHKLPDMPLGGNRAQQSDSKFLGLRVEGNDLLAAVHGIKRKRQNTVSQKAQQLAQRVLHNDRLISTAITILRRRLFLHIIAWYLHLQQQQQQQHLLVNNVDNNNNKSLIRDFADGFAEAIEKQGNNNSNNNNNSTVVSKSLHHLQTFRGAVNQLVSDASNALEMESAETRDAWLSEVDLRSSNLARFENSFSWEALDVYQNFETFFGHLSKFRGTIDKTMHSSDASFTEHPAFRHKKPLEIEFRNVWFDYNLTGAQLDQIPEQRRKKRMEKFHLKDVSFTIKPGETIGISGASGGGKSSIFKLLMRQYDPTRGQILINGVDLKTFTDVRAWRRNAVTIIDQVLAQETESVIPKQLSVRENVEFGREAITREDIDNALIAADCNSFVSRLPLGADTQIGNKFSTGERQRICIARGFAKLAPLMLFDEMTSALDAASEKKVMDGYFDLKCQSASSASSKTNAAAITTIMIAHRMATLKRADKLLIISDGRVVGFDGHDQLYKSCEVYQELYNRQSLLRKDEEKKQEQAKVEQDISVLEGALAAYKKTCEEKQSRREKGASKKTVEQIAADKKRGEEENLLTCEIETFLSSCASS